MVELRVAKKSRDPKGKFLYDNADPKLAKYVMTYNLELEEEVIKTVNKDPSKFLIADASYGKAGYPYSKDIITPHEVEVNGRTLFYFSFVPKKEADKKKIADKAKQQIVNTPTNPITEIPIETKEQKEEPVTNEIIPIETEEQKEEVEKVSVPETEVTEEKPHNISRYKGKKNQS